LAGLTSVGIVLAIAAADGIQHVAADFGTGRAAPLGHSAPACWGIVEEPAVAAIGAGNVVGAAAGLLAGPLADYVGTRRIRHTAVAVGLAITPADRIFDGRAVALDGATDADSAAGVAGEVAVFADHAEGAGGVAASLGAALSLVEHTCSGPVREALVAVGEAVTATYRCVFLGACLRGDGACALGTASAIGGDAESTCGATLVGFAAARGVAIAASIGTVATNGDARVATFGGRKREQQEGDCEWVAKRRMIGHDEKPRA